MSDHIERDGKKYFEESYLLLANQNTERSQAENERLRKELYDWKAKHFEDCGKAKLSGYEEGRKEAAREAFAIALEMQKAYSIKAANVAQGAYEITSDGRKALAKFEEGRR